MQNVFGSSITPKGPAFCKRQNLVPSHPAAGCHLLDVSSQLTSAKPSRSKGQNQLPLSLWKTQPANFRSLAAISCWAVPCRHQHCSGSKMLQQGTNIQATHEAGTLNSRLQQGRGHRELYMAVTSCMQE